MTTLWEVRVFIFIRSADATDSIKTQFATILVGGNSGETLSNEKKLFNTVVRLSTSGNTPAQAYGTNFPIKLSMRDSLRDLVFSLPQNRYYAVANVDNPERGWAENQLLQTNSPTAAIGNTFTWQMALQELFNERGLRVISSVVP